MTRVLAWNRPGTPVVRPWLRRPDRLPIPARLTPRALIAGLLSGHVLLALYYLRPLELLANPPIVQTDYATHFAEAATVSHFLGSAGRPWGYDPFLLAGYPSGTVFDVDNKGIELGTWALSRLFGLPRAFNLVILLLFLLFPLLILAAARVAGASGGAQALALAFTLIFWYLDPTFRNAWAGGIFAFVVGSGLAVLTVAALLRVLDQPEPATSAGLLLAAALSLTLLVAPIALLVPAVAATFALPRRIRHLTRRQAGWLSLAVGVSLLANALWLVPAVRFIGIKTRSDQVLQANLGTLARDILGSGRVDGAPPCLCGLRWLVLGGAVWQWRRPGGRDSLAAVAAPSALALIGLAYLGSYSPLLANLQPYRFVIPALLLAAVPAARAAASIRRPRWRSAVRWRSAARGAALLVLAAFFAGRTLEAAWELRPRLGPPQAGDGRLGGPPASYGALMRWIERTVPADGRVLVNDWRVGTLIPYYTGREVIGGPFLWTWITAGYANAGIWDAFGRRLEDYDAASLAQVLQTYNVTWVITNAAFDGAFFTFDALARRYPSLLQPVTDVAGWRIYRLPWSAQPFLTGSGALAAGYDQLAVSGASEGEVVLKYHWLPTLRTDPPLPLQRYPVPGDPVGFIAVENGDVRDFVIYNGG